MPDLWLAVESLGIVAAIALLAYGVMKTKVRFVVAGGTLAALMWLAAGLSNETEFEHLDYVTFPLRAVDAATAKAVGDVTVQVVDAGTRYRLPATAARSPAGSATDVLTVSVFVKRKVSGSFLDRRRSPETTNELEDQDIEITAPGYATWRGSLRQMLADTPRDADPRPPLVIEMHRR
ncbi:MAG TPA: hypothetical protein VHC22_28485 [Pirellulales bacterium]|nr:hypothetical protein [Pirellulales bacterium]